MYIKKYDVIVFDSSSSCSFHSSKIIINNSIYWCVWTRHDYVDTYVFMFIYDRWLPLSRLRRRIEIRYAIHEGILVCAATYITIFIIIIMIIVTV